jgi:hypothetical protein
MQDQPAADRQPAGQQAADGQQQSSGQPGKDAQPGSAAGESQAQQQDGQQQRGQQSGQQEGAQQQGSQQSGDATQQGQAEPGSDQSKSSDISAYRGQADNDQKKADGGEGQSGSQQSSADQSSSAAEPDPSATPPREESGGEQTQAQASSSSQTSSVMNVLENASSILGGFTGFLKLLLYLVLALALGYGIWKYRRELMQALTDILRSLRELFGGKRAADEMAEEEAAPARRVRTFAEFRDPFQTGDHARMPPEEVVRYTFAAFEAWANDRGRPREVDCTPQEYVRIVLAPDSEMLAEARRLARLYSEAAYAGAQLPREAASQLRAFWQQMRSARSNERAAAP